MPTISRLLILTLTLVAAPLQAKPAGPVPVDSGGLLSVGAGLVMVIGAILLCAWLYSRTQKLSRNSSDLIHVIASQTLGARERVVLLQVAEQQLLVGMTSSQVQTLHVFDEPVAETPVKSGGFAERLRSAMKGQAT